MFVQLDVSNDGFLSPEELRSGIKMVVGNLLAQDTDWNNLVDTLDSDGNGKIDYAEFTTAAVDRRVLLSQKNLEHAFKIFDTDGNGKITCDELSGIFHAGHSNLNEETMEVLWKEILEDMDTNKDGQISF
jgi:calcium-dependent protein kinase